MAFITADSLTRFGITPELISDDPSSVELLAGLVTLASRRLKRWVGEIVYAEAELWLADNPDRIQFVMAELYLALCEVLPVMWMQQNSGTRSVTIEGFRVDMNVVDPLAQARICDYFLSKAEAAVSDWTGVSTATDGVELV